MAATLAAVGKLIVVVASRVVKDGCQGMGSAAGVLGLCCSAVCEMCLDQRSNLSPALAGGFFTTEPPGKPGLCFCCCFLRLLPSG